MKNLDMDCLRAFVAIVEEGGFSAAAEAVGRTPGAVSQQMAKLDRQVGVALFQKQGRRQVLSEAGQRFLGHARSLLQANDEALADLAESGGVGSVRLGLVQDFADDLLPQALTALHRLDPRANVTVQVEGSEALRHAYAEQALDLILVAGEETAAGEIVLRKPMMWLGAPQGFEAPFPLCLVTEPCPYRAAALAALDGAGLPWRLAFSSPSLAAVRAAVAGGLGLTVRTAAMLKSNGDIAQLEGLPELPSVAFSLKRRAGHEGARKVAEVLRGVLGGKAGSVYS